MTRDVRVRAAWRGVSAGLLLISGLAACGDGLDGRRAELCRRALPALAPPGASPRVLRVGSGAAPSTVRVDYRLDGRGAGTAQPHWLVCGFGVGAELASVTGETGPSTPASVYLLKRYYLDTPDAVAATPTPP